MEEEDLAERGTSEYYHELVSRLLRLAETMNGAATRIELLDIATIFQKLAEHSAANAAHIADASGKKSG